jgi:hypothetical protein
MKLIKYGFVTSENVEILAPLGEVKGDVVWITHNAF